MYQTNIVIIPDVYLFTKFIFHGMSDHNGKIEGF